MPNAGSMSSDGLQLPSIGGTAPQGKGDPIVIKRSAPVSLPNIHNRPKQNERDKDFHLVFGAVEAQWILTVLDDCINKQNLSTYLDPAILHDAIMEVIEPEMAIALQEHFQVEEQFAELHSALSDLSPSELANKPEYQELELCLSDSTRTVTRLLRENPLVVRKLKELNPSRDPASLQFINTMSRLRKLMHLKLQTTAEEERQMELTLAALVEQEVEDMRTFTELTERLKAEREDHSKSIEAKDQKLTRLTAQIKQITDETDRKRSEFESQMKTHAEKSEAEFKATEKALLSELEKKTKENNKVGQGNFTEEASSHRRRWNRAVEVKQKIEQYDTDMGDLHDNLVGLQQTYKDESEELERLQKYFAEVDAKRKEMEEQQAEIIAKRDRELEKDRRTHQASVLVQRLFQGFIARQAAANKPKKSKSKKGKKK